MGQKKLEWQNWRGYRVVGKIFRYV